MPETVLRTALKVVHLKHEKVKTYKEERERPNNDIRE
jgi:hypothetical protein